jgi:hypothetical protein
VGRRTRRAEDIVYRLDESAPVLSRAVEVAMPRIGAASRPFSLVPPR